jgi:hypothetical protein
MLARHAAALSGLEIDALIYLKDYFKLRWDAPGDIAPALTERGLMQADVVLALLRGEYLDEVAALVGHPVERLPPREALPLPKTESSEVPKEDLRTITAVARNPRLPTTDSFQRFKHFKIGRSLHACLTRGVTRKDIREALAHGWVEVTP